MPAQEAKAVEARQVEVIGLRTATSRTFWNPDGTFSTQLFTGSIHYRDVKTKEWKPVDSRLVAADRPGYLWRNRANRFTALFSGTLKPGFLRFEVDGLPFDLSLVGGGRVLGQQLANRIEYPGIFAGVDARYEVFADSIKETLVLENANAPTRYRFVLTPPAGVELEARRREDGSWEFVRSGDTPLFVLEAPFAVEADTPEVPAVGFGGPSAEGVATSATELGAAATSAAEATTPFDPVLNPETPTAEADEPLPVRDGEAAEARMDVRRDRSRFLIDLALEPDWLSDPARRFPVLLDPTITIVRSEQDAYFDMRCNAGCGAKRDSTLLIGASSYSTYRSAVQFDLRDVPPGASVETAKLRLFWTGGVCSSPCRWGTARSIAVHRMTEPWGSWSLSMQLRFDATPTSTYMVAHTSPSWMSWDVTPVVEGWRNGTFNNFGFLLKKEIETTEYHRDFAASSRSSEPSLGPNLEVTFRGDGVQLLSPSTLHSNGAELEWTRFSSLTGIPFDSYEVHRSTDPTFTPNATTWLATIRDIAITRFRDTMAAPSRTFTYKVLANGYPSNPRTVALPPKGTATKLLQPNPDRMRATLVPSDPEDASGTCFRGWGSDPYLPVGEKHNGHEWRALLGFDLRDIPKGVKVGAAKLSLWNWNAGTYETVGLFPVTASWTEGNGLPGCSGTSGGATWDEASPGVAWASGGGDREANAATSIVPPSHSGFGGRWHDYDAAGIVQRWVNGDLPNHGVLLIPLNWSCTSCSLKYASDDYSIAPTLRPKLAVTYDDGSKAIAPTVAIGSPGPGDVRGVVTVTAAAGDDRRVEKVDFFVDGAQIGSDSSPPYAVEWNSGATAVGQHTLTATGKDDAGNLSTSAPTVVMVRNPSPPSASILSLGPSYRRIVLDDNPSGYWRLGEAAGATSAADASGNDRAGTANGAEFGLRGALSNDGDSAARFDGQDDDVSLGDSFDFSASASFSLEAWVRPSTVDGASRRLFSKEVTDANGSQGYDLSLSGTDGLVLSRWRDGVRDAVSHISGVPLDSWSHVVATYDGVTMRIYVDGVERAASSSGLGLVDHSAALVVGGSSAVGDRFAGVIDEVAIYSSALAPDRIEAHYAGGTESTTTAKGVMSVLAEASDDEEINRVEFFADGVRLGEDRSAPYSIEWDTRNAMVPAYDGTRLLTVRAYDVSENSGRSQPFTTTVGNTSGTTYRASFAASEVPQMITLDEAADPQDEYAIDVTVTNTSSTAWTASSVLVGHRWISSDAVPIVSNGPSVAFPGDVPSGAVATVQVRVKPPPLPIGVTRALYRLRLDLFDSSNSRWFADAGNEPLERAVIVQRTGAGLGMERHYPYRQEELGAGMQHLANLATGNSIIRWTPLFARGRGLGTAVDLTYNSLESASESPVGNSFSLAISSLSRFGLPLDVHPNQSDTLAGRTDRYIQFTDADGTVHRFTSLDGTRWTGPAGLHFYLREYSATDTSRRWAVTRPDRITFYYDAEGYPSGVEDRNGNRLAFTLEAAPPGEELAAAKRRVVEVTDAAGQGPTPAPNRKFRIHYHGAADAGSPRVAGKVKSIADHSGHVLEFEYYEDGNLLRLTERGGTKADGSFLPDRSFVFTYVKSDGSGPAITDATARAKPDPRTANQSTRLYSVLDPRGKETTFEYVAPTGAENDWKLASRSDRLSAITRFEYSPVERKTTLTAPLGRISTYAYDAQGRVTGVTNPKGELTSVSWTADSHIAKLTEPTGKFREYAYNDNGYLTDVWDELRNRTKLEYEDLAVDPSDVDLSISQVVRRTDPNGTATAAVTDDYQWSFAYDGRGNVTKITDPLGGSALYSYNPDGTLASAIDPLGRTTTFVSYDANGLPTEIKDAKGQTTRLGYDDSGLLQWIQDPLHAADAGDDSQAYRAYFYYDSFHRLGRQSTPKSTRFERGVLIWSGADFDESNNLIAQIEPHFSGLTDGGGGSRTTIAYDPMDRITEFLGPDTSADPAGERTRYTYDEAGRRTRVTSPKGVQTTGSDQDFAIFYAYDELDRVVKQSLHAVDGAGAVISTLNTHFCYDLAGDLVATTDPKAGLASVDCASATPHTTTWEYDAAHRVVASTDPLGNRHAFTYDANGNALSITNANGDTTARTYDERNLLTKVVEPFDPARTPARTLTRRYEYDAAGQLTRYISPRAWDSSTDKQAFGQYVTTYRYDELGRLTRVELPTSSDYPTPNYIHNAYDPNGNVAWSSLPVANTLAENVPDEQKMLLEYFDPGWIRASKDPANPRVLFDYTARGLQSYRTPTDSAGVAIPGQTMLWSYYPDGRLLEVKDEAGQSTTYTYDANGHLATAIEASGLTSATESFVDIAAVYDGFDRLASVKHKKKSATDYRMTLYAYDANGNVTERIDDRVETAAGDLVSAGRASQFAYDEADRLITQLDSGTDSGSADDQRVVSTYFPTSWLKRQTTQLSDGSGGWTTNQIAERTYFANGKLKTLVTEDGSGSLLESHVVAYEDDGVYVDGHRTSDQFRLVGPDTSSPCRTSACVSRYGYDPVGRLVLEDNGHGTLTNYTLDPAGNVTREVLTNAGGTGGRDFGYVGTQLRSVTEGGVTERFFYDSFGNLDCITTGSGSQTDCSPGDGATPSANLLADYAYDYRNRLAGFRSFAAGVEQDSAQYRYDALDRPTEQIERHGATADPKTTLLAYVGLTDLVSEEQHKDNSDALAAIKRYSYDPFGRRISLEHLIPNGGGRARYSYVHDVHGSVSLLVNTAGAAKAAYAYGAYGGEDAELTKGDSGSSSTLNPYRYIAKRLDTGSGTFDMGARRFSSDIGRFIQYDVYDTSVANVQLGVSPLTQNRYAFAGGNPVSFVETDGHAFIRDDWTDPGAPAVLVPAAGTPLLPAGTDGGSGGGSCCSTGGGRPVLEIDAGGAASGPSVPEQPPPVPAPPPAGTPFGDGGGSQLPAAIPPVGGGGEANSWTSPHHDPSYGNGCAKRGTPLDLPPDHYYPFDFVAACEFHDRCWGTWGFVRKECDDKLLRLLKLECGKFGLWSVLLGGVYLGCLGIADAFYVGFRSSVGKKHFRTLQFEVCPHSPTPLGHRLCDRDISRRDD